MVVIVCSVSCTQVCNTAFSVHYCHVADPPGVFVVSNYFGAGRSAVEVAVQYVPGELESEFRNHSLKVIHIQLKDIFLSTFISKGKLSCIPSSISVLHMIVSVV